MSVLKYSLSRYASNLLLKQTFPFVRQPFISFKPVLNILHAKAGPNLIPKGAVFLSLL